MLEGFRRARVTGQDTMGPVARLFEPDVLLPAQFGAHRETAALTSTQRLMLAVLEDAVGELERTAVVVERVRLAEPVKRSLAQRRREVIAWFESTAQDHPFAFEVICGALPMALSAAAIRDALRARDWRPTARVCGVGVELGPRSARPQVAVRRVAGSRTRVVGVRG